MLFAPNVFFISLEFLVRNTNDSLKWLLAPIDSEATDNSQTPFPDSKYKDAEVAPVPDSILTRVSFEELTTSFSSIFLKVHLLQHYIYLIHWL